MAVVLGRGHKGEVKVREGVGSGSLKAGAFSEMQRETKCARRSAWQTSRVVAVEWYRGGLLLRDEGGRLLLGTPLTHSSNCVPLLPIPLPARYMYALSSYYAL